ncbi:MAG: hypothetical protein H6534_04615 [Chthonomonadaceae bacterium]|nr:hypothetical protein [Chthonomonadaceae bacterium]
MRCLSAKRAFLGWFALAPLLASVRARGFLIGFVAAIGTVFLAAWIATHGLLYASRDPEGEAAWIATGMGLFGFALAGAVAVWADPKLGRRPLWWLAAVAVLLEACLLVELPAHLALTQYRQPLPLMLASVGGVWAVSFVLWWANFWVASMPMRRAAGWAVAMAAAALLLRSAWLPVPSGTAIFVAAIQTEGDDSETLTALHLRASQRQPALVVWPEFSGLAMGLPNTGPLKALSKRASPFVTSFRDDHKPLPHNAAALFDGGRESERYFKRKPFGAERAMHAAGTEPVAAPLGPLSVGLNICFDSCFPSVMRETARLEGVGLLALPTIDPRAPHHFMAAMHAAYSPFRAAELGVPVVRADGGAYSSIVDARGRIVAEAAPGETVLMGSVVPGSHWTVVRSLGDWFLVACGGLVLLGWKRQTIDDKR